MGENQNSKKHINFQKLREIVRNSKMTPLSKVIYIDLLLYAGTEGSAFPSQNTLASNHGRSVKQIQNCLRELKKNKYISWKKRGYSLSNRYIFNEEIYFSIVSTYTNLSSPHVGNMIPFQKRSEFRPNNSQEINQLKQKFVPCNQNGCEDGYLINKDTNTASKCSCRKGYEKS